MTKTTARERRQQKTRQAILDAARQIIAEKGPQELSMRTIAERIDYSASGLYEYFDGKEELVRALCREGHRRLTAAMQRVDRDLPPADYLVEIGLAYIDFAIANPEYYRLMFTTPMDASDPEMQDESSSSFPILLGAIRRGLESGAFKPREGFGLLEMAFAAWSIVHGMAMLKLTMQNMPLDFDRARRQGLESFVAGLGAG